MLLKMPEQIWSENGQLHVPCRRRHADVVELVLMLNLYYEVLYYKMIFGDKDSFELAFAIAGKLDDFQKISIWPRSALSVKNAVRNGSSTTATAAPLQE